MLYSKSNNFLWKEPWKIEWNFPLVLHYNFPLLISFLHYYQLSFSPIFSYIYFLLFFLQMYPSAIKISFEEITERERERTLGYERRKTCRKDTRKGRKWWNKLLSLDSIYPINLLIMNIIIIFRIIIKWKFYLLILPHWELLFLTNSQQ